MKATYVNGENCVRLQKLFNFEIKNCGLILYAHMELALFSHTVSHLQGCLQYVGVINYKMVMITLKHVPLASGTGLMHQLMCILSIILSILPSIVIPDVS